MRKLPIFSFANKMDRPSLTPYEIIDQVAVTHLPSHHKPHRTTCSIASLHLAFNFRNPPLFPPRSPSHFKGKSFVDGCPSFLLGTAHYLTASIPYPIPLKSHVFLIDWFSLIVISFDLTLTSILRSLSSSLSAGERIRTGVLPYELANRRRRGLPGGAGQGDKQSVTIVLFHVVSIQRDEIWDGCTPLNSLRLSYTPLTPSLPSFLLFLYSYSHPHP